MLSSVATPASSEWLPLEESSEEDFSLLLGLLGLMQFVAWATTSGTLALPLALFFGGNLGGGWVESSESSLLSLLIDVFGGNNGGTLFVVVVLGFSFEAWMRLSKLTAFLRRPSFSDFLLSHCLSLSFSLCPRSICLWKRPVTSATTFDFVSDAASEETDSSSVFLTTLTLSDLSLTASSRLSCNSSAPLLSFSSTSAESILFLGTAVVVFSQALLRRRLSLFLITSEEGFADFLGISFSLMCFSCRTATTLLFSSSSHSSEEEFSDAKSAVT